MSTSLTGLGAIAAGASATSNAIAWAHNLVLQATCINGGTGPLTNPTIQLWIAPASGVYYLADTRLCAMGPNGLSYHIFTMADYAGATPLTGDPNCLVLMPNISAPQVLGHFELIVTSGLGTGSTFAAAYN